jgi:predicted DNA-binding protein
MSRRTKSFYAREDVLDRLSAHTEATGESDSTVINEAVDQYLRRFEYKEAFALREESGRAERASAAMAAMAAYDASLAE